MANCRVRYEAPVERIKRLNVLVIASTYPLHEGDGAVPWLRESVNRLVDRGHSVAVLAPSYEGLESHGIDGVPVHRFRYAPRRWECLTYERGAPDRIENPLHQLLGASYVTMGMRAAFRLAHLEKFDVIHAHGPFLHGPIAAAARAACGAPVVMNSHGAEFALARRKNWVRPFLRSALGGSDRLICDSSHTLAEVRSLSDRDSVVIPYGPIVEARPTPLPRNAVPRILFTGQLIERNGVEYLIKAMPEILARRPTILQIAGDGDRRARLEHLSGSLGLTAAVEFLGIVSDEKLHELYAGCGVYVNPSVTDARGDTGGPEVGSIEALAHGRPVVASAVGGIADVVQHGITGLLVPEKNPRALAYAIEFLLDDLEQATLLAEAGVELARRQFDWDRITDSIEDVYLDAIHAVRGMRKEPRSARERVPRSRADSATKAHTSHHARMF